MTDHLNDISEGMKESQCNLEEVPRMKEILCDYLDKVFKIPENDHLDHLDHFRQACKELESGKAWAPMRRVAVYVLYINGYHNYEMAKMLRVSTKTIGRDLRYVKDNADPFWRLRGMTLEQYFEKNREIFEPYLEEFRTRFGG